MHERTQRAMARLMFVGCCAVPTMLTMTIVIMMATPWYANRLKSRFESELARDTGLVVQIGTLVRTSPSMIRLDELRLLEPETGEEVAFVRQLEWVTRDDSVSVLLRQPKLHSRTIAATWRLVHDRFLCRPEHTGLPIRFAANDLTIADGASGGMTLTDVDAWIEPQSDAVSAEVHCMLASARSSTPIDISFRRDRGTETPTTDWTLDTHDNALPCTALAKYLPGPIGNLGDEATFTGSLRWQVKRDQYAADQWWMDMVGSLDNLSLDRVFEKQPHRLTGNGSVRLERCRIDPFNQSMDVSGTLLVSDGQIGRSLLASASQNLGFELVPLPDGVEDLAYDRIAMRFSLNDTQLQLNGICHTEVGYTSFPAGIVLHSGGYALVRSGQQTLPAVALMSVLAPSHSVTVPISSQNAGLLPYLIPPSRPLPLDAEAMRARIQTARQWSGGEVTSQPY
ncbi:MAG: hypothetical protein WBD31_19830 [Rubripirellula sp.]